MKLEPIFSVKDNSLFFVDGTPVGFSAPAFVSLEDFCNSPFPESDFIFVNIEQSQIELGDDLYNEEILATFRDRLLISENLNKYIVIVPISEKNLSVYDDFESFANTFNHTVRRVKDCKNVAGFMLPENLLFAGESLSRVSEFIEIIAKKHSQFVYFVEKSSAEKQNLIQSMQNLPIELY